MKKKGEHCEVCGTFVEGFEYKTCCDGRDCGCLGLPIEPCICSNECWDSFCNGVKNNKDYYNIIEIEPLTETPSND